MYTFENINKKHLCIQNILDRVPDHILWRYYLGYDVKIGGCYRAPYRDDNTPSFCIFKHYNGRIWAKDMAGYFTGDIINYIEFINNVSFKEALVIINKDFKLDLYYEEIQYNNVVKEIKRNNKTRNKQKNIYIKENLVRFRSILRKANESDISYWRTYGISTNTLRLYKIQCVDILCKDDEIVYTYNSSNPCYEYNFKSGNKKYYFPFRKKQRFLGNTSNNSDIQGYYECNIKEKVTPSSLLILTKSMKDVMLLRELGYDSMAIHGENHKFNEDFIRHIKKYRTNIISLYDRDNAGILGAKYLWKNYKIKPYFIPKKYNTKDISDLYKEKGKEIVEEFLKNILLNNT